MLMFILFGIFCICIGSFLTFYVMDELLEYYKYKSLVNSSYGKQCTCKTKVYKQPTENSNDIIVGA